MNWTKILSAIGIYRQTAELDPISANDKKALLTGYYGRLGSDGGYSVSETIRITPRANSDGTYIVTEKLYVFGAGDQIICTANDEWRGIFSPASMEVRGFNYSKCLRFIVRENLILSGTKLYRRMADPTGGQ